jgi:hypothetical protein
MKLKLLTLRAKTSLACALVASACASPVDLGNHAAGGPDASSPDPSGKHDASSEGGASDASTGDSGAVVCSGHLAMVGDRVELTSLVGSDVSHVRVSVAASADKILVAWGGQGSISYAFLGADGHPPTAHNAVSVEGDTAWVVGMANNDSGFYVLWTSHAGSPPAIPQARFGVTHIAADGSVLGTQRLAWIEADGIVNPQMSLSAARFFATYDFGQSTAYVFGPSADAQGDQYSTVFSLLPTKHDLGGRPSNAVWTGADFAFLWGVEGDYALARLAPDATSGTLGPHFPLSKDTYGPTLLGRLGNGFVVLWTPQEQPDGGDSHWFMGTKPIRAMRLDGTGAPIGDAVDLTTYERGGAVVGSNLAGMSAAWNGSEFFLVTSATPADAGASVGPQAHKLHVVDPAGTELSPPLDFDTDMYASDPEIAWSGRDYVVVWGDGPTYTLGRTWLARASRCN